MSPDRAVVPEGEWLEVDGHGGFASGTASGIRSRRYHALLLCATRPPTGRVVLVNGFEAWVETPSGTWPISSQSYAPGVVHPDGASRIESFRHEPWPRWVFRLEDGTRVEQECFVPAGRRAVCVVWRLVEARCGVRLHVRPLLSVRDYHALHHENTGFRFDALTAGESTTWRPYDGLPAVVSNANARYEHAPDWYRRFLYEEERARGLDDVEDLASPGVLHWDLSAGEAVWILEAVRSGDTPEATTCDVVHLSRAWRDAERGRRGRFASPLHRAASSYVARRESGSTLIAGYPWFTDWGRDTFIALRGIGLATGELELARDILLEWSGWVSEGMLPNRFPDGDEAPEYNAVDASLWYACVVHEYLAAAVGRRAPDRATRARLVDSVEAILAGYAAGTRYGIRLDSDGLIAAGEPGVQLTWMDAKVGDWVVTPRIGKPVEVQALWLNALAFASEHSDRWRSVLARGLESFRARFWNEEGYLYDVVDVDHRAGVVDSAFRPNQIFAVGGLPMPLIEGKRARGIVEAVESRLLTPIGLRSLAPDNPAYAPRYEGGVRERDGSYHQGTVWPWLLGPFVEAWVRVRGRSAAARREARRRFLAPIDQHVAAAGLGHVSEIADGDAPHTPRGCPFQAWSVGECLRLDRVVLAEGRARPRPRARRAARAHT